MKKKGKRMLKKMLAALLALSMAVTMLPETLLYARAQENSEETGIIEETESFEEPESFEETESFEEAGSFEEPESFEEAEVFEESETTEETDTVVGAFEDMSIYFSGFYARWKGSYVPSAAAQSVNFYVVEYDAEGQELARLRKYFSLRNGRYTFDDNYDGWIVVQTTTSRVAYLAVENQGEDADGNPITAEVWTALSPERENIPNISVEIETIETLSDTVCIQINVLGDMAWSSSGRNWQRFDATLTCTKEGDTEQIRFNKTAQIYGTRSSALIECSGKLEPSTVYNAELEITVRYGVASRKIFSQTIQDLRFETTAGATYQLAEIFPDEAFRNMVIEEAGLSEDAVEITTSELEKITYLSGSRLDFNTAVVKDITGIEYLTELTELYLQYHEVADASSVDWSKLEKLERLALSGNELTKIPDLSKNQALNALFLDYNLIPAEEFEHVSERLPEGVNLSESTQSTQRIGGLQIVAEDTYYQRFWQSPLLVMITGYKPGLPYTFKYIVDGSEVELPESSGDIRYNVDTGIALGSHTLRVEMYAGSELAVSKEMGFVMAGGGAYADREQYCFSSCQESFSMDLHSEKKVAAVYLKDGDRILAQDTDLSNDLKSAMEYRYEKVAPDGIGLEFLVYTHSVYLERLWNKIPEDALCDVVLAYEDGTEETLEGVARISSGAVITGGAIGHDYDSTGDSFYLSVNGYHFDAGRLDYVFTYKGVRQEAVYVDAKETSDGWVVRFQKSEDWTPGVGDIVQVKVAAQSGYQADLQNDTFSAYISQGIYYCAYNKGKGRLEVGVTSDLVSEDVVFALSRYNSWSDASGDQNCVEEMAVTKEVLSETLSCLTPVKDGAVYALPAGYYRLGMTCGEKTDYEIFVVYESTAARWSGSRLLAEGMGRYAFVYYSAIGYDEDAAKQFTARLTGADGEQILQPEELSTYAYGEALTAVNIIFDLSSLSAGAYAVELSYQGDKVSEYGIEIVRADKFIITDDYIGATWIDDTSFQVYFDTVNVAETDSYTVTLTDIRGNEVEGLQTEVERRYSDAVYLKVTGLSQEDAYRYYYIRVVHESLGEPYQADGETKFFPDERGSYRQIYSHAGMTYMTSDGRAVGIGVYSGAAFPVTLKIYRPYNSELVTSVNVKKSDIASGTENPAWYYFKQSLIDALPDADALYDIVAVSENGYVSVFTKKNIGVRKTAQSFTVSPESLELKLGSETAGTAVITVSGNTKTPTFESSNEEVASVKVSADDKNQAVVTAVGKGSAAISVTVDGETKAVPVTVVKELIKADSFTLKPTASELVAGDTVTVQAVVEPAEAWTAESSITYASSDSNVAETAEDTGRTCRVTAKNPGTTVITAVLHSADGSELTASCEIRVLAAMTDEEKDNLAEEIGTLYFLEEADVSLASLELPEGWTWTDPEEVPVAYDALPIQTFEASYSKEGHESFAARIPVRVSRIESVEINGPESVLRGERNTYRAVFDYVGYPLNAVEYCWTAGANVSFATEQQSVWTVAKFSDADTLKLELAVSNPKTGARLDRTAEFSVRANDMLISPAAAQPEKAVVLKETAKTKIVIDAAEFDRKKASKLALEVNAQGNVKWKSCDTSVMSVDKKGVVTIKKPGVAVITATADGLTGELEIRVEDYTPVLEKQSVTVYQYSQEPAPIGLVSRNGNEIVDVAVSGAANLLAVQNEDGEWCLEAQNYAKKTTEKVTVSVTTKDREAAYELSLKVTVDVTRPDAKSVKFKQTVKPNIFYCGEEAVDAEFTVSSSKYVIEDIYAESTAGKYQVKSYDPTTGKLVLTADGLDKNSLSGYDFAARVYVKVQGYEAVPVDVKVATQNKKPSLKLGDAVLIDGVTTARVSLYSGKNKVDAAGLDFGTPTLNGVSVAEADGGVSVSYSGSKSGRYRVTVSKATWTSDVTVSGKVSVVDVKKLALETNVSKITINTGEGYCESVRISAAVKGNSDLDVQLNAKDAKKVLTIVEDDANSFEIFAPEGKKGSYKVQITGTVNGVAVKSASVTVVLTDKAPEVKLAAKGSINLANRTNTSVVYTPTLKNLPENLSITKVTLDAGGRKKFSANLVNGKVVVQALPGVALKAKQKYNVQMTFTLSNGKTVTAAKPVTVTPVDKLPKVKASAVSANLYKTDLSHEAEYKLRIDNGCTATRLRVEPDKKGVYRNFDVDLNADGTVNIRLNRKDVKAGTYYITCRVIIQEADNSKPVKVKFKVVVK